MAYVKRHRAGEEMPKVVHLDPDPRAVLLCQDLVEELAVQAVILSGSRYRGRWDEQSDLDILVILEDGADQEELKKAAAEALAKVKERHYPGYQDRRNPDHGIGESGWIVSMDYFVTHRRTHNHPMAQAATQGRIFARNPADAHKYEHDGDTSNEWELVTLQKLRMAAKHVHVQEADGFIYKLRDSRPGEIFSIPGGNAYWQLWHAGSAILSMLGITYPNRSLVGMAESLKINDPGWSHQFQSDLDCLDQYNWCACEVVVTNPIPDLQAMWEALAPDREALWARIEELSDRRLESFLQEEREKAQRRREERARG
ncbi:MAG: nucleotidyltransferase domain-containing protein [Chloroflexi bacterium]|nr:nucleotidyltransferase domain-containing protein [Chloroflexota bacterium]